MPTLFQSLKGILVDFNQIVPPVLINSKVFQSLKGILVDFNGGELNWNIID